MDQFILLCSSWRLNSENISFPKNWKKQEQIVYSLKSAKEFQIKLPKKMWILFWKSAFKDFECFRLTAWAGFSHGDSFNWEQSQSGGVTRPKSEEVTATWPLWALGFTLVLDSFGFGASQWTFHSSCVDYSWNSPHNPRLIHLFEGSAFFL